LFTALIGVTFPFFVLVSTMGVLISLVAIPLRENVPIFSADPVSFCPENRLEIALGPTRLKPLKKDFKLLKFLILRIDSD